MCARRTRASLGENRALSKCRRMSLYRRPAGRRSPLFFLIHAGPARTSPTGSRPSHRSMYVSDQVTLFAMASRYGIEPSFASVLRNASLISNEDLATIGGVVSRLSDAEVAACVSSPGFATGITSFVELARTRGVPHNRAVAFLKIGVPLLGISLPERARQTFDIDAVAQIRPSGVSVLVRTKDRPAWAAVDLSGCTQEDLHEIAARSHHVP